VFCHNSSSACCAFVYDRSEPLTAVYCRWLSFCLSSQNGSRSVPGSRSGSGRFLSLAGVPGFGRIILFTFCSMWIETAAAGSDTGCGFFCARHLPVTASDPLGHRWQLRHRAGRLASATWLCHSPRVNESIELMLRDADTIPLAARHGQRDGCKLTR